MNNENIVPVTYNGKVVGWVDSNKTPIYISPIDDESQKLLEELMSSSIYISSRQTGLIDENEYIRERKPIEYSVNKLKKNENE
jgi:hypothetical protein